MLFIRNVPALQNLLIMNIGVYPGSFNPIHNGHVELSMYICKHCGLDEIWLLVSPNNPLKDSAELWDEQFRLCLAKVATEHIPQIRVSDFEFHLPRPSYTADTLKDMTIQYPEHRFSLIIGSDNLAIFNRWRNYEYILSHYPLIVYPRQGDDMHLLQKQYPDIQIVSDAPLLPVSSTMIRQYLRSGKSVAEWVAPKVSEILEKKICENK